MKKSDIEVGQTYLVKVSGKLVPVKIVSRYEFGRGGWIGTNQLTKRKVTIRSAQRLRCLVH